jgi:hypothetical protein
MPALLVTIRLMVTASAAIELRSLSKRYDGARTYALHNVSLTVMPGEVYGFLGANGAGKSTAILATTVATLVFAWLINLDIPFVWLAAATGTAALVTLVFGALAFMLTAMCRAARAASVGIATLLLIGSYLFTSLSGTVTWLRWPARLLPYHYYHPADILAGNYHWPEAIGMLAVIVIFGAVSYIGFRRRDIS